MWYVIFFIAAIPPILFSIFELVNNRKLKKKKALYRFSLSLIIVSIMNLFYTPYDKYNGDLLISSLDTKILKLSNENKLLDSRILKLSQENKLLYEQNGLLDKSIKLVDKKAKVTSTQLNKIASHISQFSVFFYIGFKVNSKINLANKQTYFRIPLIGLISSHKSEIGFSQSPPSYELKNIFEKELINANHRIYTFSGVATVEGGGHPIGSKLEVLKDFTHISIYIPLYPYIERDDYGSRNLEVLSCNLTFTINGIPLSKNTIACSNEILALLAEYPDPEDKHRFATVQLKLKKPLYDELNLNNLLYQ